MSFWTWPAHTDGVAVVLEFWIGSIPVATGAGAWIKRVTGRRHKERLTQERRQHQELVAAMFTTAAAQRREP